MDSSDIMVELLCQDYKDLTPRGVDIYCKWQLLWNDIPEVDRNFIINQVDEVIKREVNKNVR